MCAHDKFFLCYIHSDVTYVYSTIVVLYVVSFVPNGKQKATILVEVVAWQHWVFQAISSTTSRTCLWSYQIIQGQNNQKGYGHRCGFWQTNLACWSDSSMCIGPAFLWRYVVWEIFSVEEEKSWPYHQAYTDSYIIDYSWISAVLKFGRLD